MIQLASSSFNDKVDGQKSNEFGTEFTMYNKGADNVPDFTERSLMRLAKNAKEPKKFVLMVMLEDYLSGNIAVSWHNGKPRYLRVCYDEE